MDSEYRLICYVLNPWWNPKYSYILTCKTHVMHLLCRVLKGSQMMNVRSWHIASVSLNRNHFIFVSKGLVHGKSSNNVWRSVIFTLLWSRELIKGEYVRGKKLKINFKEYWLNTSKNIVLSLSCFLLLWKFQVESDKIFFPI